MKPIFAILFSLYGFFLYRQSQTTGASYVASIESKALAYEKNKEKIAKLKLELPGLEQQWKQKMKTIADKIATLTKERDALIADMKVGARCSECKRWKTELEKQGINFQQHLGEVKGYAIPASTPELESVRKEYTEKIAIQKVQLQRLQNGDDEVKANMSETERLAKANEALCGEITKLSKDYETTVLQEARKKQEGFAQKLVDLGGDFLISNDWVAIHRDRIVRKQKDFQTQSEKIKQQLETENKAFKEQKSNEIIANNKLIAGKQSQKDSISNAGKDNVGDTIGNLDNEIVGLKSKNQSLALEISYSDQGLPKKMRDKILEITPILDKNISDINNSTEKARNNATIAKKKFDEEVVVCSKLNNAFVATITEETNRMVLAGQRIGCPVWNATSVEVASNWNQLLPCIRNVVSSAQINPYCSKWNLKNYLGKYLGFLASLDKEDLKNVQTRILYN